MTRGKKTPFEDEFPIGNGDFPFCHVSFRWGYEKILSPRGIFVPSLVQKYVLQNQHGSIQGPRSEVGDEHSTW